MKKTMAMLLSAAMVMSMGEALARRGIALRAGLH